MKTKELKTGLVCVHDLNTVEVMDYITWLKYYNWWSAASKTIEKL